MEAYQWFLLGMMVAWTPGLLVLALMLRQRHWPSQRGHLQSAHTVKTRPTAARRNRPVRGFGIPGRASVSHRPPGAA